MSEKTYTLSLFSNSMNPALNKEVEKTVSLPWSELAKVFLSQNWSPAVYENRARNLANYRGSPSLFAFDIDEGMTIEEAKIAFQSFQCLIYTSRNHQKIKKPGTTSERPACDRFRVVFALSEPIANDEDYKATWEAYASKYPLDKQTRSSSMFFFHGQEVVFNQPSGSPLEVIKAEAWKEVKSDQYAFVKDEANPSRGILSHRSQQFMSKGASLGMFNLRLFQCAVDHMEQRYTEDEFLGLCVEASKRGAFYPLDDTDLATVRSAFNREPKYGPRSPGATHLDAQKKDIVDRIMDGEFLQCIQRDSTLWYRIKDFDLKEVELIANQQIIERHIQKEVQKPENHYNTVKKVNGKDDKSSFVACTKAMKVEEVLETWKLSGQAIDQVPEPILWQGVEGWCHKRFAFELMAGQAHPGWDEFLSRITHPEVFKAWVFSCFVSGHETRQALWLKGSHGEDGKSRVIRVISELFGDAAASLTASQTKDDSRFVFSQFVGKRLVVYPDCKNLSFPQAEIFRNFTGGDMVTVEFKRGGFLHKAMNLKVLIASNFEPRLTNANYDKSRLIIIEVAESQKKDDPSWSVKLREELPAFLGNAQVSFKKLCPNNGKIILPEEMSERLDDFAGSETVAHDALLEQFFKIDPNGDRELFVRGIELVKVLEAKDKYRVSQRVHDFSLYLESKYKVLKARETDGYRYRGLLFKDPNYRHTINHGSKDV